MGYKCTSTMVVGEGEYPHVGEGEYPHVGEGEYPHIFTRSIYFSNELAEGSLTTY